MKQYPKYKPSGIDWIGDIPSHWDIMKYRRLFSVSSGDFLTTEVASVDETEYPVYGGNGIRGYAKDFNNKGPMLLIGRVGAKCGNLHLAENKFWVSEHALRVFPKRDFDLIYFKYLLELTNYNQFAITTAQPLLNSEIVLDRYAAIPPIEEQTTIANFLDEKTTQIDQLIANKQKLIELLKEERTALINEAVSGKGKNWERKKLKYVAKIISGASFNSSEFSKEGNVRVLKISNIQHDYIDWTDAEFIPDTYALKFERFRVFNGDIVFALTRPIISSGIKSARAFFNDEEIVLLNQRNAILRVDNNMDATFIYFVTHSDYFFKMFELSIDNTGQQPNISTLSIMNFEIIIPPLKEQKIIVNHIQTETERIDTLILKTEKEITLMQEYRTALISEVVTGKVKVA